MAITSYHPDHSGNTNWLELPGIKGTADRHYHRSYSYHRRLGLYHPLASGREPPLPDELVRAIIIYFLIAGLQHAKGSFDEDKKRIGRVKLRLR